MREIKIYSDGGSRGNPGQGAVGFVVYEGQKEIYKKGERIGHCTNNEAEYQAVLKALSYIEDKVKDGKVDFYLDSELVVKQLNGEYRVKDAKLKPLFLKIREKVIECGGPVSFSHISREKNKIADSLVNAALDAAT